MRKRLILWYVTLVFLILADEYVKEGYILRPRDFLIPFTHENLLLVLTLAFIIAYWKLLGGRDDRDNS
ncbi:hypothetical protein [Alphaspiravirus yamagawaense]|uniref:Uncharacterized protein n=1 Tax=Alphaspiravirus yamagawaense TaxID=1157339 RepID=J7QDF7_9VIRU|nr:hypothetical protein [Aeropyrum coil-shaped virus]CCG27831.1 hypothetical protein [Aeropyrum coil-shaped virus]